MIYVLGDLHLSSKGSPYRLGDYASDVLDKLQWAVNYCNQEGLVLVLLGDVFHHKIPSRTPYSLVNRTAEILSDLERRPVLLAGNHDLQASGMRRISGQPLYTLARGSNSFLVETPTEIRLSGLNLTYLSFQHDYTSLQFDLDGDATNVLFSHMDLGGGKAQYLDHLNLVHGWGFDYVFNGHIHDDWTGTHTRPGSSHVCHIFNLPLVGRRSYPLVDIPLFGYRLEWSEGLEIGVVGLPAKPLAEVFDVNRKEIHRGATQDFEAFIQETQRADVGFRSLSEVLEEVFEGRSSRVVQLIRDYLDEAE